MANIDNIIDNVIKNPDKGFLKSLQALEHYFLSNDPDIIYPDSLLVSEQPLLALTGPFLKYSRVST